MVIKGGMIMTNNKEKAQVWTFYDDDDNEVKIGLIPNIVTYKHHNTGVEKVYNNVFARWDDCNDDVQIVHEIKILNQAEFDKLGMNIEGVQPFYHPNISRPRTGEDYCDCLYIPGSDKAAIEVRATWFCNPIHAEALNYDPYHNLIFLGMQLEDYNFDSPLNSEYGEYLDFEMKDHVIRCKMCGSHSKSFYDLKNVIPNITNTCVHCFNHNKDQVLKDLQEQLVSNPDKLFYKIESLDTYSFKTQAQYESDKRINYVSEYYPVLNREDIEKVIGEIPRQKMDVCVMGLGSAGSGLIDQIARTTMFKDYTLIDFDKVEEKNLRNQVYTRQTIGYTKVAAMTAFFNNRNTSDRQFNVKGYEDYFQNVPAFKFTDYKYIMLGFDSIPARLEAFNKIANGEIIAEYIMDTRYDDLTASVFFIDTKDPEQMEHYKEGLEDDLEILNKVKAEKEAKLPPFPNVDPDSLEFAEFFNSDSGAFNMPRRDCHKVCDSLLGTTGNNFCSLVGKVFYNEAGCGSCQKAWDKHCKYALADYINTNKIDIPGLCVRPTLANTEVTCVSWNIIDVYKYASTYLTASMREIEHGQPKAFTHLQVTTNGLPCALVMKD